MELIIFAILLGVLVGIIETSTKGVIGEKKVAAVLAKLPKEQYKVLHDIMLRTENGTTQIDHVVVSIYGIFVIETKNYKGWITGNEYGNYWTKNMYGKKYSFRNPLMQNYAHIKALQEKTGLPEDKFISIVAFSSNSDIKVKTKKPVVYIREVNLVIQAYKRIIIQPSEINGIVSIIQNANITERKARREHVQQIREKVSRRQSQVLAGKCPKCGGQLVRRNGKRGPFVGCNNYPGCRYTENG